MQITQTFTDPRMYARSCSSALGRTARRARGRHRPDRNRYGLQTASDGKSEGFRIPEFGGSRANVPLQQVGPGDALARLITARNLSAAIDSP